VDYVLICLVALLAAGLTFFSGFGLGTILMPAFAVFFPVPVAVAATAVVHLANNVFKLGLVSRHVDRGVLVRFGVPALLGAFAGAGVLTLLADLRPLAEYELWGREARVTPVKLLVAVLMAGFAVLELAPGFDKWAVPARFLPLGGVLSGFFGGMSGHQGALRSAFLIRAGLSKEAFIATGVAAAVLVDVSRLAVYGLEFTAGSERAQTPWALVAAASAAAFAGSLIGAKLVKKVTLRGVRITVGVLLLVLAGALGAGVI
jgi:uncharacterized membrane protein YfcA